HTPRGISCQATKTKVCGDGGTRGPAGVRWNWRGCREEPRGSLSGSGKGDEPSVRVFDKAGVIHVHTRYSDGAGSVRAVARAAVRAGVDFVVVTDHDTLAGLRRGEDGWYDRLGRPTGAPGAARTLVVIGQEISP